MVTWDVFKAGLLARYGPTQFYDYFGELTKLQQTGSVRDYQSRFENLLAKAGHLPPARQVSCFISGLKEGIKADVLAGRPMDLSTAIGLARLYEARNLSQRRPLPASTNVSQKVNKEESSSRHPSAIRRMSPAELKERRDKGLCYNCNDKFAPGHRCKKLFLIEACNDEDNGDVVMDVELVEENEVPGISLHAMSGSDAPETMRVRGAIGIVSTVVLLDSGSTHNFVSEHLATKLNLQPATNKKVTVEVASGEKLSSKGKCNAVSIKLGGFVTHVDFYILPLEGYEAVLGTQWLRTLGEILWNFSKMTMRFNISGKEILLKGLTRPKDKVVADTSLWRNTKKPAIGAFLQLDVVREVAVDKSQLMPEVQELLDAFSDLFEEPIGLPPTRV